MMGCGAKALQPRGANGKPQPATAHLGTRCSRSPDLPITSSAAYKGARLSTFEPLLDMFMTSTGDLSRRLFLQCCGAFAAAGASGAAAQQDTEAPAPACWRHQLGERELIVLSDGHLVVPTVLLAGNVGGGELMAYLASVGFGRLRSVHFHINVELIRAGEEHILIDAGACGTW